MRHTERLALVGSVLLAVLSWTAAACTPAPPPNGLVTWNGHYFKESARSWLAFTPAESVVVSFPILKSAVSPVEEYWACGGDHEAGESG